MTVTAEEDDKEDRQVPRDRVAHRLEGGALIIEAGVSALGLLVDGPAATGATAAARLIVLGLRVAARLLRRNR